MKQDINFDKFNPRSINVVYSAYNIARTQKQNPVDVSHLLFALLDAWDTTIENIITSTWNTVQSIKSNIENQIFRLLQIEHWFLSTSDMHMSRGLNNIFFQAQTNMEELNDAYIRPEHLLLAITQTVDPTQKILSKMWISSDKIKKMMQDSKKESQPEAFNIGQLQNEVQQENNMWLLNYWEDITRLATENKLDKIFFRDTEINNIVQVLLRSYNNNVIVVGEPWSGKTAIVNALAQKISDKEVPESLQDTHIISIDIWKLSMDNKYTWDLEKKLKSILSNTENTSWKVILFIDDFKNFIELFKNQSTSDLWVLLKSFLSKWNIKIIWTTDIATYNNSIQSNTWLSRLFQKVEIQDINTEDTTTILRYQKDKLEKIHSLWIAEEAILASVQLADRYIFDREFPDKAISLLDEATARKKMHMLSVPDSLLKIRQKLLRLETEKNILLWQNNANNKSKLDGIDLETQALNSQYSEWFFNRENNKKLFINNQSIYKNIIDVQNEIIQLSIDKKNEKLILEKENIILNLKKQLQENWNNFKDILWVLVSGLVTKEDVEWVVSLRTWIPVYKINKTESQKLLEMEGLLSSRVVGQEKAVKALSNAVRRARSWLSDPNKPIWSFIFLWSTWVWKTELAKALADILFDDEKFLIRIDMSEYQEKHSVSRLIWSPPWYVGYDEWWQLTEAVRAKPYSVILFDEMEKADPDVFKLLLQALDDWRLTDGKWRTISFKNTIIIMTSNIWWDVIIQTFDEIREEKEKEEQKKLETKTDSNLVVENTDNKTDLKPEDPKQTPEQRIKELEEYLNELIKQKSSPEFLNRIDETIMFNPIDKEMIIKILDIQLKKLKKLLSKDKNMSLELSDRAKEFLSNKWRNPAMGARPIKRAIQYYLINLLSIEIISWNFHEWDTINVDCENDKLVFKK